jgi:amino-acid N-acetyltransferase
MLEPLMIRRRPPRSAALVLLQLEGLPVSDLTDKHLEHFFFIGPDGSPTGLVGLEIYGANALLRSLVVDKTARTRGIGSALVQHAEEYAFALQVRAIYLLTTTAESFFGRLGYRRAERAQTPAPIQSTREFATLCPASSAFMVKRLNTTGER